jgi:8-oxo-dGTP diphosphatase
MIESADSTPIRIAAALICADGRTLLVRKRGSSFFMQPGGKIEADETPEQALRREIHEELGLLIEAHEVAPLGAFAAAAANEPGRTVVAELFLVAIDRKPVPGAEIEEIAWIDPAQTDGLVVAPLTRDHILPLLAALALKDNIEAGSLAPGRVYSTFSLG